jgi:hypothetical protein
MVEPFDGVYFSAETLVSFGVKDALECKFAIKLSRDVSGSKDFTLTAGA